MAVTALPDLSAPAECAEGADPGATRAIALARARDRASEAAHRQAAAHAVWAEVGEAGSPDRTAGVAAGRAGIESPRAAKPAARASSASQPLRLRLRETGASPVAGATAAANPPARAEGNACPECGGKLRQAGRGCLGILEYVPASFKVIRHVRPKLSCAGCDCIVQAPAPSRPIERGLAGPGLLAHVLVQVLRSSAAVSQSEIYARRHRTGTLDAGRLGGRSEPDAGAAGGALRRYVTAASKLHADDTPVPVLAPGNGKTKTGRLWTYVRDDRPAGDSRRASGVVRLLAGPQRRASRAASGEVARYVAGRCLRGVQSAL